MSEISKVEQRILHQIENNVPLVDVKIDLSNYINHRQIIDKDKDFTHTFLFDKLEEQDCLLMQVPNINESGYYAGIVALKSYIDKFHSDLKVAIIDPVIDYFYVNPPDKQSEFFQWFNTYANQGEYEHLYTFPQMNDIIEGFVFKYIEKTNPAFFGFSIIDGNIDASIAIARKIKQTYPHIKILFGGNGIEVLDFGVLPNVKYTTDDYFFIDVFARGDGEVTFVEILKSDMSDESLSGIKGIVWRNSEGKLIHNIQRESMDLDILPMPDYSSLEENYYYNSIYQYNVPLVLSRGCPYRCTFCSVPEFIPIFRYRKLETVIEEIEYWINKGKVNFFCHDSIINGDPKWLKRFCEAIIQKGWPELGFSFGGNMRLQTPMRDLETMRLYRKAGLLKMITGFESAAEPVLKHMKKYPNMDGVREIFENVRIINKENQWPMQFAMQLIIGYLNETEEDFQKTVDFVKEYHDCMSEILTCSGFLLHETLKQKWIKEGNYIEFQNTVNFTTNYNTAQQRLDRLNKIEEVFKEIGITHSVYNRGLYYDLIDKRDYNYNHIFNVNDCKIPEKIKEYTIHNVIDKTHPMFEKKVLI
jgi:pyruvate-formate lyase-activating enzyme